VTWTGSETAFGKRVLLVAQHLVEQEIGELHGIPAGACPQEQRVPARHVERRIGGALTPGQRSAG
jgi:hypothetical protein